MEDTIPAILSATPTAGLVVLGAFACAAYMVYKLAPILSKRLASPTVDLEARLTGTASLNGNGSKPVSRDGMQAQILEHCARCERIGEIKEDIREMRLEMREGFRGVHQRIDEILR